MIRISAFVWIIVLGLLGVGLFQVKYNVQSKEAELRGINKQIEANRSAMHVLDAEWSYLNDPTRLADLTRRHTDLVPTQAGQLKHFADLPPRPASAQPALPALSSATPSGAGPANPVPANGVPAGAVLAGTAPSSAVPSAAAAGATIIPASASAGTIPTASPAVASPIAAGSSAAAAMGGAVKAKAPAAKAAASQSVPAAAQQVGKPATGTVAQPGADEVIDAILADMQRKQAGGPAPAAGDQ